MFGKKRVQKKTDKEFLEVGYGLPTTASDTKRLLNEANPKSIRLIVIVLAAYAQDTCLKFAGYKKAPALREWLGHPPKWSHPVKKAKAKQSSDG